MVANVSAVNLPVSLRGVTVSHGKNGRSLGYPTANIETDTALADGVYVGLASLGKFKRHPALVFIGAPVTVGDNHRRVEAHLINIPNDDYYDQKLTVEVMEFLRPDQRFNSLDGLLVAMRADEVSAHEWFNTHELAITPVETDTK